MTDWIYGINPIEAALAHDPENLVEVLVEQGAQNARVKQLAARAKEAGVSVHGRPREQLDKLTGGARHQGIVAHYKKPERRDQHDLGALLAQAGQGALILILDGVTD